MGRKTLIVGNWKMHLSVHEASTLVQRLNKLIKVHRNLEIVLAPSFLSLQPLSQEVDRRKFRLSSQDGYSADEGHFTGEVSFSMMRDLVHYGIVGHSARRIYFHDTLEVVRDKVKAAIRNDIVPILCVGESKEERNAGETKQIIHDQVTTALSNLTAEEVEKVVIAYEPVWAISTFGGEVSKPDDMQKAMKYVRYQVQELYGEKAANKLRVLYGGSVDEHDARAYLELEDCDGVLVGAASLNHHKFAAIVESAHRLLGERGGDD